MADGKSLKSRAQISQVAAALGLQLQGNTSRCIHPERHKHGDANPSLSVVDTADGGYFKCFVCGAKGDSLRLIQEVRGWDFKKALAWLAEFAGEPNKVRSLP